MASKLLLSFKKIKDGLIIELVVWEVVPAVSGCQHSFKYRLYCGAEKSGQCLVRYDNERGKGDHRHLSGVETQYFFSSLEKLFEDFEQDIREVLK